MEKFSVGKLKILISKEHRNLAMNLILVNNLSFEKSRILDNMDLELIIKARNKNDFEEVFSENGINAKFGEPYGAFAYMFRYRHRVGLFLGIFIFVISVYLSSLFVWRIDISGNEFTSDKEIIEAVSVPAVPLKTAAFDSIRPSKSRCSLPLSKKEWSRPPGKVSCSCPDASTE